MRTKYWIWILSALLLLCIGLSLWLFWPRPAAAAVQVYSQGQLLYTLPLSQNTSVTVETEQGTNTVTVQDGKVAVTAASCPDHHCMNRGFCDGGMQIVCLPNRLVLKFTDKSPLDGITG